MDEKDKIVIMYINNYFCHFFSHFMLYNIFYYHRLVGCKTDDLIKEALENYDKSGPNIIQAIAEINPDAVIPKIVGLTIKSISESDLKMSMDDFAIYLTPEGQLYDTSPVDNLKESNDAKNIKRENKVLYFLFIRTFLTQFGYFLRKIPWTQILSFLAASRLFI